MSDFDYDIFVEEVPPGTTAQLTPGKVQKVLHLVRHGQATHNVFAIGRIKEGEQCHCMLNRPGCPYLNPANEDARLTQKGRLQATAAGPKLLFTRPSPQLVLVSPLFRTLQTCSIALSVIPGLHVPVVAEEMLRERCGLHVCDKRSEIHKVRNFFQQIDFSNISPGPDQVFTPDRETEEHTAKRGKHFLLSLRTRPETSIAIFTHSSLLFNTLSRQVHVASPHIARRFVTGEVRCVLLTYKKRL